MVENLLKIRFGDRYEFFSSGISPTSQPNMDPRSLKFLKNNNIHPGFHTPKRINEKMLNYFDKFLAVDFFVLSQLNNEYPKYRHKFASLTMQFNGISILDPYRLQDNEYLKIMNNIKHVSEKINLEQV